MLEPRPATAADIPELVRLRALMLIRMAEDLGPAPEVEWEKTFAELLSERLGRETFRAVVVPGPSGEVVACGIGMIHESLPGPWNPSGRAGEIANMATDPGHRRQGHARAVLRSLLGWFTDSGITKVELKATADGETLYRSLGFVPTSHPLLTWRP